MNIGFDRRQFLAGSAGALSLTLLPKAVWATTGAAVPRAPVARIDVVRDTYFGETLADPYRWMENDKDPEWLPFLKGQNDHARAVLDALPTRVSLLKRVQQLSGDTVATSRVQRAGGLIFFTQRPDSINIQADNNYRPNYNRRLPIPLCKPEICAQICTHITLTFIFTVDL